MPTYKGSDGYDYFRSQETAFTLQLLRGTADEILSGHPASVLARAATQYNCLAEISPVFDEKTGAFRRDLVRLRTTNPSAAAIHLNNMRDSVRVLEVAKL